MHQLFCGVTMSGKTTLARIMTRELLAKKQRVIVYDPVGTSTAGGDWGEGAEVFDDLDEFLEFVNRDDVMHCHVFIDEADLVFSIGQKENHWMLRRGRHYGMFIYPITQRPTLIAPNVRAMCQRAYVFRLIQDDIKTIAADYGFSDAHKINLDKGDFICFTAGTSQFTRGNVFKLIN